MNYFNTILKIFSFFILTSFVFGCKSSNKSLNSNGFKTIDEKTEVTGTYRMRAAVKAKKNSSKCYKINITVRPDYGLASSSEKVLDKVSLLDRKCDGEYDQIRVFYDSYGNRYLTNNSAIENFKFQNQNLFHELSQFTKVIYQNHKL